MTRDEQERLVRQLEGLGEMKQDHDLAISDIEATRRLLRKRFVAENEHAAGQHVAHRPWGRFAYAAVTVLVLGVLATHLGRILTDSSIAWADVVERFRSVSSFNAAIYIKNDAAAEPKQLELWVGSGGKARLRVETQVLFAQDGDITSGFDFRERRRLIPDEYHPMGARLLDELCQAREFSLDTVVQTFGGDQLRDLTPLLNAQAVISQDIVVFDLESDEHPEWIRIWALRESRLPVRLRMWDPRNGRCMDVVVSYGNAQPDKFFDERVYEQLLTGSIRPQSSGNLAYALLKDPGGRDYAPQDLVDKGQYHLPVIRRLGISPHGAVWILADNAENQRPNGRSFYGFGALADDLGRSYTRLYASLNAIDNQSIEVFVPAEYPFDRRVPKELTIICRPEQRHPDEHVEPIGTVTRRDWEPNTVWPTERLKAGECDAMLHVARRCCDQKQFEQCDKIADLIKATDQDQQYADELEDLDLRRLIKLGHFDPAASLARKITPRLMHEYLHPAGSAPEPGIFNDTIVALAGADHLPEAEDLYRWIVTAEPDLSRFHPTAQRHFRDRMQREFEEGYDTKMLVRDLVQESGCTVEEVNRILGQDVRQSHELSPYVGQTVP